MDWSEIVLLIAVVAILVLYLRLMRKNRRLRHEAAEEQKRNRQLKQEMTSNIAHELKTPVSSIRGYLEILLGDHAIDEERRRHYLERSYRQTLRLSDLIKDVSLINKAEESSDLFPKEDLDVHTIAQEAFNDLTDKANAAGIALVDNLPSPMPIHGNRELLYAIFRNLTENAVAYAGEGCRVVIETYQLQTANYQLPTQSTYHIHLFDTGRGVPDADLARLFDRFVRIDEGRSRQNGGTGLGLSIVKHAVLFHGGEIYAKNRPEGGLEFFFSLK